MGGEPTNPHSPTLEPTDLRGTVPLGLGRHLVNIEASVCTGDETSDSITILLKTEASM